MNIYVPTLFGLAAGPYISDIRSSDALAHEFKHLFGNRLLSAENKVQVNKYVIPGHLILINTLSSGENIGR